MNRIEPILPEEARKTPENYMVHFFAYTFMPNRVHGVLPEESGGSIQRVKNAVQASAAKRFDFKYDKVGNFFPGR